MYRVMLVDDEQLITKGLQVLLDWEDFGFAVCATADSGEAAIAYLKENKVDILITDIMMAEMTGLELIEEALNYQPHLKTIVLTGYQDFNYIKQGLLLGIENYLVKPVDKEELQKTVQAIGKKLNASAGMEITQEQTTLKDNALWNYLHGEIEKNDLIERLSLYDVHFTSSYYNVSVLDLETNNLATVKRIRAMIEKNYRTICLFSPSHELILVFGGESKEELLRQNQQLAEELVKESANIGFFYLSMGEPSVTINTLEESYAQARERSLHQIYFPPNELITDQSNFDKQEEFRRLQEFKENTSKLIMAGDQEALAMIDDFFKDLTRVSAFLSAPAARKYAFDLLSYIHHSIQSEDISFYTAAIERMLYSTDAGQMKTIMEEYVCGLLSLIQKQSTMRSPIVQNVLSYIHSNYDQGISLKVLGQQFHVNSIYLGQLFQKEVGVVFSEYLNRIRLEKAKELLKTTHNRAGEIGKMVGYSDTAYFYKQFKKNVGATPSEWRKI